MKQERSFIVAAHQEDFYAGREQMGRDVINLMGVIALPVNIAEIGAAGFAALSSRIAARAAATEGGSAFFQGAKYSPKVLRQMSSADDLYYAFPKSVDGFANKFGQWSIKVGADGKTYQWLKMHGSYGGKTGTFEFIKDANGVINHRFFNIK